MSNPLKSELTAILGIHTLKGALKRSLSTKETLERVLLTIECARYVEGNTCHTFC